MTHHLPPRPPRRPRIVVVGDLILDRYTWGDVSRVSPEAPIPILAVDTDEVRPGGAASVASLLTHLEADVTLLGVIGEDAAGRTLTRILHEQEIHFETEWTVAGRPTTCKHRFVGRAAGRHPHQMLRVDQEVRSPLTSEIEARLLTAVQQILADTDVVLISDYAKGVCTPHLLAGMIEVCGRHETPILIDPARGADPQLYRGATLLTPNRLEAQMLSGKTIDDVDHALIVAENLRQKQNLAAVMVTLDRDGIALATAGDCRHIPTTPRDVYDITGAGDMVLAILGYATAAGWSLSESAAVANVAAGLEVERFGVEPVYWWEIDAELARDSATAFAVPSKVCSLDEAVRLAEAARRRQQRIVFTNGCFDLFHAGHLQTLEHAASRGDVLFVAVNSDASVRRLKGSGRPVICDSQRAQLLAALACIDHVLIFDDATPHRLLTAIRPDILVKGGTTGHIEGREVVEAYGGRVERTGTIPQLSTTELIALVKHNDVCGSPP